MTCSCGRVLPLAALVPWRIYHCACGLPYSIVFRTGNTSAPLFCSRLSAPVREPVPAVFQEAFRDEELVP